MKNIVLFLDDCRDPFDKEVDWMIFSPIGRDVDVVWVKSYDEFTKWIIINGLKNVAICFDHDLGEDVAIARVKKGMSKRQAIILKRETMSGMDCAKWLVEYCYENKVPLPPYAIQSANPVGRENIDSLLKNYIKHVEFKTKD